MGLAAAAALLSCLSLAPHDSISYVETVQWCVRGLGVSRSVARQLSQCHRGSSLQGSTSLEVFPYMVCYEGSCCFAPFFVKMSTFCCLLRNVTFLGFVRGRFLLPVIFNLIFRFPVIQDSFIASLDSFFCAGMSSPFTKSSVVGCGECLPFLSGGGGGACVRALGFSRSPYGHDEGFIFMI